PSQEVRELASLIRLGSRTSALIGHVMVSVVFRLRKPFSDLAHGFNVRNTFEELSIVLRQPIFDSNLGDVVPRFQFSRSLFRGLHSRFRLLLLSEVRLL